MRIETIDLFCGIGGLSYGLRSEGLLIRAGIDTDESCKYAFEKNLEAQFIPKDVSRLSGAEVARFFSNRSGGYRVLVGCAPCPPFSIYTGRYRKILKQDPRAHLLNDFMRIIRVVRPDVVSMENVPRIAKHGIFMEFVESLEEAGYNVSYSKVRAERYGVPQRRTRLVLLASRWGKIVLPSETHDKPVTVRQVIGHLPKVTAGEACKSDKLHVGRGLTPRNLARIKSTQEGGSWRDWDEELQLSCHRKRQGRTFRSVYGRMRWDALAPVITTQCLGIGNGRFGHPDQDRAITIREAALLQTFPIGFKFVPPTERISGVQLARQIGNAVPVRLGQIIGQAIRTHLGEVKKRKSKL